MPFQTSTHASLLARLNDGEDTAAWQEFDHRYRDTIWNFARRRGLQPADADDVVQEVLLAVSRNAATFVYDPARGRFRGYLKTLALRTIWHRQRKADPAMNTADPEAALAGVEGDAAIEQEWDAEWRQYHLRLAMQHIRSEFNWQDLAIFDAYVANSQPATAVATAHDVSVDLVYQVKSRILRRLRAVVAEQVAAEG